MGYMAPSTKDLSFSPEDNLSRYLYRIREYPMLEPEEELDLATVLGTGFAPFRGGLMSHAKAMGESRVRARLAEFAGAPDGATRTGGPERYTPAR